MATLNIVPLDSILELSKIIKVRHKEPTYVVDVVQDADARLVLAALPLLPVVGLPLLQAPGVAPLAVSALPRGWDPLTGGRPVPAVLNNRLEVLAVTALKQKETSN